MSGAWHDQPNLASSIPANDFRVVLGFTTPWKFAAKNLPPQSTLDSRVTVTALARQLLDSPKLKPVPNGDQLYETRLGRFVEAMQADASQFVYLDEKACENVDIGDATIRKAILFDKKRQAMLVAYYNPTDTDRLLAGNERTPLIAKAGYQGYAYILDPVEGYSQWNVVDFPAHRGKLELIYPDNPDFYGPRRGPYGLGTMLSNAADAVAARKAEMEPAEKKP